MCIRSCTNNVWGGLMCVHVQDQALLNEVASGIAFELTMISRNTLKCIGQMNKAWPYTRPASQLDLSLWRHHTVRHQPLIYQLAGIHSTHRRHPVNTGIQQASNRHPVNTGIQQASNRHSVNTGIQQASSQLAGIQSACRHPVNPSPLPGQLKPPDLSLRHLTHCKGTSLLIINLQALRIPIAPTWATQTTRSQPKALRTS